MLHDDVPTRDAATVALLRDGDDGIETWLMTRVRQMVFAAGMSVFPGGRLEDSDAELPMTGSSLAAVAARFGADEAAMRGLIGAAARETFEESGVLLTTPPAQLPGAHAEVEAGTVSFGALLDTAALTVDADLLVPWSRWVTPQGEVRRYDTRFFVAALPAGAVAVAASTEAARAEWVPVRTALAQGQAGERGMLPPTLATLADLAAFSCVADALAASSGRALEPIEPVLRVDGGSVFAELPDGRSVELPASMFRR